MQTTFNSGAVVGKILEVISFWFGVALTIICARVPEHIMLLAIMASLSYCVSLSFYYRKVSRKVR